MVSKLSEPNKGVLFAVIAHLFWGGMAPYFGLLRHVNPWEIAVNRGVWSVPIAAVVVWQLGLFEKLFVVFRSPRTLLILAFTSTIIFFNWTLYIWCIQHGRTLEASLGYFVNPLMNVVVGYVFLRERFSRMQGFAIFVACLAVLIQTIATGVFPWLALSLASSFCLYGLLRKTISVGPVEGFFVETAILLVPLLMLEFWLSQNGGIHFGASKFDTLMLMGCGAFTAGALIFFAASLKRLRFSTAGLLQYISPSLVFLTAVFIFKEQLDVWRVVSFAMIWVALAIYSLSSLREA